jgi:hypothetical protein
VKNQRARVSLLITNGRRGVSAASSPLDMRLQRSQYNGPGCASDHVSQLTMAYAVAVCGEMHALFIDLGMTPQRTGSTHIMSPSLPLLGDMFSR